MQCSAGIACWAPLKCHFKSAPLEFSSLFRLAAFCLKNIGAICPCRREMHSLPAPPTLDGVRFFHIYRGGGVSGNIHPLNIKARRGTQVSILKNALPGAEWALSRFADIPRSTGREAVKNWIGASNAAFSGIVCDFSIWLSLPERGCESWKPSIFYRGVNLAALANRVWMVVFIWLVHYE